MTTITWTKFRTLSKAQLQDIINEGGVVVEQSGEPAFQIIKPLSDFEISFLPTALLLVASVSKHVESQLVNFKVEDLIKDHLDALTQQHAPAPKKKQNKAKPSASKKEPAKHDEEIPNEIPVTGERDYHEAHIDGGNNLEFDPFPDSAPEDLTLDSIFPEKEQNDISGEYYESASPFPESEPLNEDSFSDNSYDDPSVFPEVTDTVDDLWEDTDDYGDDGKTQDADFEEIIISDQKNITTQDDDEEDVPLVRRLARKKNR